MPTNPRNMRIYFGLSTAVGTGNNINMLSDAAASRHIMLAYRSDVDAGWVGLTKSDANKLSTTGIIAPAPPSGGAEPTPTILRVRFLRGDGTPSHPPTAYFSVNDGIEVAQTLAGVGTNLPTTGLPAFGNPFIYFGGINLTAVRNTLYHHSILMDFGS